MKIVAILVLFLSIILGIIFGGSFLYSRPFKVYNSVFEKGVDNDFVSVFKPEKNFLAPVELDISNFKITEKSKFFWDEFHFRDFLITVPTHNPNFLVVPYISTIESNGVPLMGMNYIDQKLRKNFLFRTAPIVKFDVNKFNDKLFTLPLFKEKLLKTPIKDIWIDLFSKKIAQIKQNDNLLDGELYNLIYNLYILKLRKEIFTENIESFSFYSDKQIGIIKRKSEKQNLSNYTLMFLNNSFITSLDIEFRNTSKNGVNAFKRFVKLIKYKESNEEESARIYAKYKSLSYQIKVDQEGLAYLFSAWSHIPNERGFIREMIFFLERGRGNSYHLGPLYKYAFRKFGTSFSADEMKLRETAKEKLKRLIKEEDESEIGAIGKENEGSEVDINDSDYKLQKVKDKKINDDTKDNVLEF